MKRNVPRILFLSEVSHRSRALSDTISGNFQRNIGHHERQPSKYDVTQRRSFCQGSDLLTRYLQASKRHDIIYGVVALAVLKKSINATKIS